MIDKKYKYPGILSTEYPCIFEVDAYLFNSKTSLRLQESMGKSPKHSLQDNGMSFIEHRQTSLTINKTNTTQQHTTKQQQTTTNKTININKNKATKINKKSTSHTTTNIIIQNNNTNQQIIKTHQIIKQSPNIKK